MPPPQYRQITLDDHTPPVAVKRYVSPEPPRLVALELPKPEPASSVAESIRSVMAERIIREGFEQRKARAAAIAEMRKPRTRVPAKALRAHVSARRPRTRERRASRSTRPSRRPASRSSGGGSEPRSSDDPPGEPLAAGSLLLGPVA
jgi:hypothetical protein